MHTTTLGELGPKLPIGIPKGKELLKSFSLRPFKSRIDRHLGQWMEANGERYGAGQLVACQVAKLLSLLVSEVGGTALPVDEEGNSLAAGELQVHQWYFADVMYLYLFARVQSLGEKLEHPVACPAASCGFKSEAAVFDLNTVDVRVADSPDDLTCWLPLKRPTTLRDGSTLNQVKLEPLRWATMAKPGVLGGSMAQLGLIALQDTVCAVNGKDQEYRLTPAEIDELEKIDRVAINRKSNSVSAGVDLKTSVDCPKCGTPIVNPLNWTYDYFFDASLPLET